MTVQLTEPQEVKSDLWFTAKKYGYSITLLVPALGVFFGYLAYAQQNPMWLWWGAAINFLAVPIVDAIVGPDGNNPSERQQAQMENDPFYVWVMYAATVGHWLALATITYAVTQLAPAWYHYLGAVLSIGAMHSVGLVMSHELGHRINQRAQVWAAKAVIACSGYGHFNIEHNKGHHKHVATPEDPASSRMGENLYKFAVRELPGAFFRAMTLEKERLERKGKGFWSTDNEIIHSWLITLAGFSAIVYASGLSAIPFLIVTAFYGWFQLTMANYIEHYGLLRQKLENGRYERCQPHHSWNSNFMVSNLVSLHLQRHSDHHANPARPYQLLRDYPEAPQMPAGYPGMMLLSMFPPLWYRLMDPKVADWAKGDMTKVNMDADNKDKLFAKYHQPCQSSTAIQA